MPLRNSNLSMPQMAPASSSSSSSMSASTSASVSSAASASAVTESSEPDRERERERTRNRVSARIHNATRIRAQRTPSFAVQKLKSKIANAHPLLHHHHSRTGHDENEQVPWRRDTAAEENVHVGERPRHEIASERQEIDSRAVVHVNDYSSGVVVNGSHESHASHGNDKQSSSASPADLSRKVEEQSDCEKADLEKNVQRSLDRRKPKLTADARAFLHNRAEKRRQHIAAAKEKVSRKAALFAPALARQLSHNKHKEQQHQQHQQQQQQQQQEQQQEQQEQQQQQRESAADAADISQSEQTSLVKNESLSTNPAVPVKEANLEHLSSSPSSSPLQSPSPVQSVPDFDEFEDVVVAVESIADETLFREARAASEVALMTRDSVSATAPTSAEQETEPNANTNANADAGAGAGGGANANTSADISKPTAARLGDRDRKALNKKGRGKHKDRVGKESALQFARSKSKAISIRLKAGKGGGSSNKASDSAGAASAPVSIVAPSKSRWRKRRPDGAESNSNAEKSSGDEAKSDAEHKEEPAKAVKKEEAVEVIGKNSDVNAEKELETEEENIVRSLLHDDFIEYQAYVSRDKGRGRKLRPPWASLGPGKESESD